jgi:glycosyltransferase involved in cell wall biosynthesis
MKIAHVVHGYYPDLLYQEGYLVREQLRGGHEVVVFTRHVHGAHPHPLVRILRGQLPALVVRLARGLRRERPDVVHVHNVVTQISVAACLVKPLLGYRLVLDSHHSTLNTRINTPLRRVGTAVFRMTVGLMMRRAAEEVFAVAGPERAFTARLLGCDEERIGVVPLGVDTDVFHPDPEDRRAARVRLGLEAEFVVAHAGRLVPEKNLEVLLSAAERIGATALLIGSLDERVRPVIERARASGVRVVLAGVLTKDDLASALRTADVGVWMGWPSLSAVDAMAVGLPLITRGGEHFRELLGADYPLVATDADELTRLLTELRANRAFAAEIGSRNAERAASTLSWTRIANRVELIYAGAAPAAAGGAASGS